MNNYTFENRGSEWRKWDLHIHTPLSGLNNNFPKLTDGNPDWEKYISELEKIKDVAVLGITDYFSIEGYDYLQKAREKGRLQNFDLLIPNVELRLSTFVGDDGHNRRLNLHVIFSNEIPANEINEFFLNELKFEYDAKPGEEPVKRTLRRQNLEDVGKRLKTEHKNFQSMTDYEVGCTEAYVEFEDICTILRDKRFTGKHILILADEDLSKMKWDGQDHLKRKVLVKGVRAVFSATPSSREFCLGWKHKSIDEFVSEFGYPKPCLNGSDAHSLDKLCKPDLNRYCWIKADPSFEGLKQVLYEPEARVVISEFAPSNLHAQLKGVVLENFDNSSTYCLPSTKIIQGLSPNLTAIIGGRGTGKTMFAELIAYVADQHRKPESHGTYGRKTLIDKLTSELHSKFADITLFTGFGQGETSYHRQIPSTNIPAMGIGIDYWQQGKIEESTEDDQIRKLVAPLLTNEDLQSAESELSEKLELAQTLSDGYKAVPEIRRQLKNTKDTIEKHKTILSTVQDPEHKAVAEKLKLLSEKRREYSLAISYLVEVENNLTQLIENLTQLDVDSDIKIIDICKSAGLDEGILLPLNVIPQLDKIKTYLIEIRQKLQTSQAVVDTQAQLQDAQKKYAEILAQIGMKQLTEEQVATSTEAIARLVQLEKRLNGELAKQESNKTVHTSHASSIITLVDKIQKIRQKLFEEQAKKLGAGIKITDCKVYDQEQVVSILTTYSERKNLRTASMISDLFDNAPDIAMTELITGLEKKKIPTIISKSSKETTTNYFIDLDQDHRTLALMKLREIVPVFQTRITQNNKDISELSFGERCALALRIILASGDNPLIIDQPEDQLDNEFIWDHLLNLIREKKANRQIIVITHNPNIVVNADAELVIVLKKEKGTGKHSVLYSGGIENNEIRTLITKVLEGGETAFLKRERRYEISSNI